MRSRIHVSANGAALVAVAALVAEVERSYRRAGCKQRHAYEQAADDLGITPRRVQAYLNELSLVRCSPAEAALIAAGHARHTAREADRLEARAAQMRARIAHTESGATLAPPEAGRGLADSLPGQTGPALATAWGRLFRVGADATEKERA